MSNEELLNWCEKYSLENEIFDFPDDIFGSINKVNSKLIVDNYGKHKFMRLPKKEIKFFEWLKTNDRKVWDDLWKADEEAYIVSINFLPMLLDNARGFPICDLVENDNYYFTEQHAVDQEAKLLIESVQHLYHDHKQLTVEQTFILEVSLYPIDVWRFAYRYGLSVERAKKAVDTLVEERILVHLKDAEHLANFIDF